MELNQIIDSVKEGNPEAAAALVEHQTAFNNTMGKLTSLEKDIQGAAEKRDRLKTIIRNATGLEEISEDGLKDILSKGGAGSETLQKEIESLREKLGGYETMESDISSKYEQKIFNMNVDKVAMLLGASDEAQNAHAYKIIVDELSNGIEFGENNDTMYKNPDGTTVYNGANPMTAQGRYEQMKADDDFAYLFKPQFKKGGGKSPSGPTQDASGASLRRSQMKPEDKTKYITKFGMASYKQLAF